MGSRPFHRASAKQSCCLSSEISGYAIFAPAVGARPGLVVGEVIPCVAVFAVVFAHGAPLALAEVWSPLLPGNALLTCLVQPFLFSHFDIRQGGTLRFLDSHCAHSPRIWRWKWQRTTCDTRHLTKIRFVLQKFYGRSIFWGTLLAIMPVTAMVDRGFIRYPRRNPPRQRGRQMKSSPTPTPSDLRRRNPYFLRQGRYLYQQGQSPWTPTSKSQGLAIGLGIVKVFATSCAQSTFQSTARPVDAHDKIEPATNQSGASRTVPFSAAL